MSECPKCLANSSGHIYDGWECLTAQLAAANAEIERSAASPWRPSIHMPRWASRITLEVKSVRVERVQEISEADAQAEGVIPEPIDVQPGHAYRECFRGLWDSLNAARGFGWDANPFVWVVEFNPLAPPAAGR